MRQCLNARHSEGGLRSSSGARRGGEEGRPENVSCLGERKYDDGVRLGARAG